MAKHERAEELLYTSLGTYQPAVAAARAVLRDQRILQRIEAYDYTVWQPEPTGVLDRLGWLRGHDIIRGSVGEIESLVAEVRDAGYTQAIVLGMGGASLMARVLMQTFGPQEGFLRLEVLDTLEPVAIQDYADWTDLERTLFIVASKSGTTLETLALFRFFYTRLVEQLGSAPAAQNFVAITDPDSDLATLGVELGFRRVFLNDPNVGGRYAALSFFGLLPAGLLGLNLSRLLDRATMMAANCASDNCPVAGTNNGAHLGAILGTLAQAGRDKLTLVLSPRLASFGAWIEQVVAESTGKGKHGIVPVVNEPPSDSALYGDDRLFVSIRLLNDTTHDGLLSAVQAAGHPVVHLTLSDLYDLGGQCFLWMLATTLAATQLGINPFTQPDIEATKNQTQRMVAAYRSDGLLHTAAPVLYESGLYAYADMPAANLDMLLVKFLSSAQPGAYIALHAYLPVTHELDTLLHALRTSLRDQSLLATTLGYGPRLLHSTGQLHKGDAGRGLIMQFTADSPHDVLVPDTPGLHGVSPAAERLTFGVLLRALALGDWQALRNAQRQVVCFHLGSDPAGGLRHLRELLN